MEKILDEKINFKGKEYFGRIVPFHNKEMDCDEELLMYEGSLGEVLEPYAIGNIEDADSYDALVFYDRIFCFVPKDILIKSDDEVIKWCYENNIDL